MASEELQEPIEQKMTSHEAKDLEPIYNPITNGNIKEKVEIKSNVLDGNIVNKDGDLVEEGTEVISERSNSVEPNQIITEKTESLDNCTVNLEEDIKEQEIVNYEETTSTHEEATTQEQQEKVNGETDSELHLTRLTEKLSPEVVEDETPASADPSISEQVEEKMDIEEVTKEDAHQNQVPETEMIDNSASEKTNHKEAEVPIGNASQYVEEDVTEETVIPSSTTPLAEKVLDDDKENNDVLEEVQKEQVHQIEAAKENLADEKACPQEIANQGDISPAGASDEKIPEEPSHENHAAEMICEEVKQTEDTSGIDTMDDTSQIDNEDHIPCTDAKSYDLPFTNEEINKSNDGSENMPEEVKETDVSADTSPLISEEAMDNTDIKEDTKEEAHQNQISEEGEIDKDASQCISAIDLSEKDCQNETEKAMGNASSNGEKEEVTKEVDLKEVEGTSSGAPPVSEEVLVETIETTDDVEEEKMEQVNQNETECLPETEVQTRDVSDVVISEETMPEEAREKGTPEMISDEVKPTESTIAMSENDETNQNDNGENSPDIGSTSSYQPIINEEISKTEEDSEHVVEESTIETAASRDVTPEFAMEDTEIKILTSETDDKDIEKNEDEDEVKSSQEVKPSESLDSPLKIEETTPNDSVEEKLEDDDELKHKKTDDEKEVKSFSETEEQLDESKPSSSVQEVSAEINTVETETVKETEEDEKNVSHDAITLDSKETPNNDENTEETREMNIAEKHDEKDSTNGDELGDGDGKDNEIKKGNIGEISEPIEPSNNTEAFIDTEIPREDTEIQCDNAVSAQLTTSEEALQETPSESTTLSEMERENTVYNSERDNVGVENSHEDDQTELPDRDDKEANASEDQIEENAKISTHEHNEVDQKLEVEERSEENLFGNIEHETTPVIQNVENPLEKDDNIKSEIIEESQASIVDNKIECEKLGPDTESELQVKSLTSPMIEEGDPENSVAEGNQNDAILPDSDELESQVKTTETESNEEGMIIKEPYAEHENEPESSQVEGLTEVTEALEKEDQNKTSDMSSDRDQLVTEEVTVQDSLKVVSNGNENESEKLEVADDEMDLKPKPEEKTEAETLMNEEITERLVEVEPTITHYKEEIPEAESTVEHVEALNEPSISSTEQDQQSQESDAKPTENQATDDISVEDSLANAALISSIEQLAERSVDKEEVESPQEENVVVETPKEETEEAENLEESIEEITQITNPNDVSEVELSQSENVAPETEHMEVVSKEKLGDESNLTGTDVKSAELENITHELTEQEYITREAQIGETEITTEEYQPDQESDAKPTELDQATDEVSALENPEVNATLNVSVEQIGETSVVEEESVILRDESEVVEMPKEETEKIEGTDENHIEEEVVQIVHSSELTEPQLDETEPVRLESEDLEIVSNEKIGDESGLIEIDLKSAQVESTSDELIKDELYPNLSSSVDESEVLLQSTGEEVQGGTIGAEMPKEENSEGIEPIVEPCDKPIEEIHKTVDPEICDVQEEPKALVTEMEVDPQKFDIGTESPELEKLTEESASVEEKADATILVPSEGQTGEKEIANEECGVEPQTFCESVITSDENVAQGVETNEGPSDKDTAREISKCADAVMHDAAVPLKVFLNEEEVDSEKLGTEIESSEQEKATEESALVEDKSDADAMISGKGQIEERDIADKESSVAPQSTVESVTVPEEKVSQEIETNEPIDKHNIEQLHGKDILIDTVETPEETNFAQEDKVDEGQATISKNVEPEMESSFLEKTNRGIDVNANLEETSETLIVEEKGRVISETANGSELVPVVEQKHSEEPDLIDEKISSDATLETANSTETNELQVQEEAPDTVVIEPENQTKEENLTQTEPEQEIPEIEKVEGEKEIPNVAFEEPVSGEINGDTDQKGVEQNRQNALNQEAHRQNERKIDMIELMKTAEQKVTIDESSEKTEEIIPNFPEQNKEAQEETNQSEGPEDRDFSFIVSSFLISKVLSEETQKEDNNTKQNDDASFISKALDGEFIQENTTNKKEEIETADEEIMDATSSREDKLELQEQEKVENGEEKGEENEEEDGVQQDYLPVSRFLMDKILRQEEKQNLEKEVGAIEETHKQLNDEGGVKIEEKIEENSNVEAAPEQTVEVSSSYSEVSRDFEKGETLIEKVDDTSNGDGAMFIKVDGNSNIVAVPKQEGEASHSSIEVATDLETESDVVKSNLERDNKSVLMLPEQEGEKSISPIEAVSDFEKENNSKEENETLVTTERISIVEKIQENNGGVATSNEQGGKTYYPVEMGRYLEEEEKPEDEDKYLVGSDDIALPVQQVETAPSLIEEVELENREQSKDLIEEALVNAHEISEPEKIIEENRTLVIPKEIEQINEVVVAEEALKDVKNVEEENYVLVEHEVDQFEESKEILEKEKVAHEIAEAAISNLEEKEAISSAIEGSNRDFVQQVEITESGMKNSSVSCKEIDQTTPDIPRVPVAEVEAIERNLQDPLEKQRDLEPTEIMKEQVGNETNYTSEKEQVKEVTGTVVERIQSKNQEKLTEVEATKMEKEREEIKDEDHDDDEDEGEEEDERHQEREAKIIGRDLTVKAEARDQTEMKPAQKKSHNILSGVGSKVKHSLAKVKKAITGKSKNVSPSAK